MNNIKKHKRLIAAIVVILLAVLVEIFANRSAWGHAYDLREYFDTCLNLRCDLFQIQIFVDRFFQIWQCTLVEFIKIHRLDIFTVHPS